MIAILKKGTTDNEIQGLVSWFEEQGVKCQLLEGNNQTIISLRGKTSHIDTELVESLEMVESIKRGNVKPNDISYSNKTGIKTVGVVGLGIIGASYAKAFRENSDATILGYNRTLSVAHFAKLEGTIDDVLTAENIGSCDLIIVALYPDAIIDFVKEHAKHIKKGALVVDAGGLKRKICRELFPVAKENGFTFVGGHPMAGKRYSGYKYATGSLFKKASLIICPEKELKASSMNRIKEAFAPCEFGRLTVCTPEEHDEVIAFTSEMPHIISNAFIKSPTAKGHKGFSAGSYNDMTRVAWLNETMWTEIFLENRDNIIKEIDYLSDFLEEYRKALVDNDADSMWNLLHDGKLAKEEIDGK
ncbi:MAG: prephenate dehydrogenase/arogenate dehydrogenase family protein [Eubacterium sp.]|nr:prephenate dehydrogenase/arogenate dehydrogenase family protein [Eubacterium sp.]